MCDFAFFGIVQPQNIVDARWPVISDRRKWLSPVEEQGAKTTRGGLTLEMCDFAFFGIFQPQNIRDARWQVISDRRRKMEKGQNQCMAR